MKNEHWPLIAKLKKNTFKHQKTARNTAMKSNTIQLTSQIAIPLLSVVKHSATLDCGAWPPRNTINDKVAIGALLDYEVKLKGLESIGVASVIVRFDVEFQDCILNTQLGKYLWDGKEYDIWGGGCEHNLTFESSDGTVIPTHGENGVLQHFGTQDDQSLTSDIVDVIFSQLSDEEKSVFLRDVLNAWHKGRSEMVANTLKKTNA